MIVIATYLNLTIYNQRIDICMQRQLKQKPCKPIWKMMPKLLLVMGLRYDKYKLEVAIELDDDLKKTI